MARQAGMYEACSKVRLLGFKNTFFSFMVINRATRPEGMTPHT